MDIIDKLKKYFSETSKEQIQADWEETKKFENVNAPTVEEFLLYNVGNTFVCDECDKKIIEWKGLNIKRCNCGKYTKKLISTNVTLVWLVR